CGWVLLAGGPRGAGALPRAPLAWADAVLPPAGLGRPHAGGPGFAGELLQAPAHGRRVALNARNLRARGGAAALLLLLLDVARGQDRHAGLLRVGEVCGADLMRLVYLGRSAGATATRALLGARPHVRRPHAGLVKPDGSSEIGGMIKRDS